MNVKELLLGLPVLFFVIWVFAAPAPQERISRSCEPINWVGNLATSTTALSSEANTATTARWSDQLDYSCKYMAWRLIYEADYKKAVAAGQIKPQPQFSAQTGLTSPSAASAAPATAPSQPAPAQVPATAVIAP